MCAGFKAGTGNAHRLVNESNEDVVYLEIGDRTPGDAAEYPDDDIRAERIENGWRFTRKARGKIPARTIGIFPAARPSGC